MNFIKIINVLALSLIGKGIGSLIQISSRVLDLLFRRIRNWCLIILAHTIILLNESSKELIWMIIESRVKWGKILMTIDWEVIIVIIVFGLLIEVKISKVFSHLIVILFHLLLIIIWRRRNVLSRLAESLAGLPCEIRTLSRRLSKLLIVDGSLIFSGVETSMKSLRGLLLLEEILLGSRRCDVHPVLIIWQKIVAPIVCWLLLWYKIVGPCGWVTFLDISLFRFIDYY